MIDVDSIESVDLLTERCGFIAAYGQSLYGVLAQELLRYEVKQPGAQSLGRPVVVHDHSIVCFESGACDFVVGSLLVAQTSDHLEPFRYSPIESIQIGGQGFLKLTVATPTQFGVKVSFRASDKFEYYILPADII